MVNGVLDQLLRLGVDGGGGLIQHEDARVGQHGTGKGNQLLLAGGETVAALTHIAVPAIFQLGHHRIRRHGPCGGLHLLVGGVQLAVADVLPDAAGEQVGILQHIADVGVEPQLAALAVVHAVNEDMSLRRLEEPAGQIDEGTLAGPRFAYDGHRGPLRDVEGEVLQHVLAAVGIAEGHIPELDLAPQRLPVLPLGVEGVAVFLNDLRGVLNLRLFVHQVGYPLDGGLQRDELRQIGGGHLDGVEDADGIGGKGRQSGQLQRLIQHHIAAPQQHDRHRHGAEEQHQRDKHRIKPGCPDAGVVHLSGETAEGVGGLLLRHQRLGGACAGDALVEGAGDAGVQLTHLPVPVEDAVLKIPCQNGHHRHNGDNCQRQLPVQRQHGGKGTQHIEHCPQDIRKVPRQHTGDAVGVAHDTGQQIAHRGHVIKGEGQGLQVVKQCPTHILAQIHLDVHGVSGKGHHRQCLHHHHRQIRQCIGQQPRQGVLFDKILDGVLLEQGQHHVHQSADAVEHQHGDEGAPIGPQERPQPLPDPPVEGLSIFLFINGRHARSPLPPTAPGRRSASECCRYPGRCRAFPPVGRESPAPPPGRRPAPECGRPA